MSKINKIMYDERFGRRVDVKLYHSNTTEDVYWSPRKPTGGGFNSYVLLETEEHDIPTYKTEDGKPVLLVSINGMGEIRWEGRPTEWEDYERYGQNDWFRNGGAFESLLAAQHFKLSYKGKKIEIVVGPCGNCKGQISGQTFAEYREQAGQGVPPFCQKCSGGYSR